MTIEELLEKSGSELTNVINELRNGRNTPEPNSKEYAAQYDPKLHEVNDRRKRPDKLVVVDKDSDEYGEVKRINPNVELTTEQGFRIEPVARIALAIQKLIVKRAVAFTFGNPVTYNANPEDEAQKALLQAVNRVFYDVKEETLNRRIARSLYSTTEVAELWYPVETEPHELYGFKKNIKFKVAVFSPMFGDRLYPYFDEARDLIAFSREFTRKDRDLITRTYFETYTKDKHYLWSCEGLETTNGGNWKLVEGYPKDITIGKIPIIYASQPQVEWEDVQSLIDRLEKLLSNFADTNDYHASPKIFVQGKVVGFARKGEAGAIIEGEQGATAQYLSWANAPESVKLEIDTLLRMIYTITQTPDISFDTVKGLGAISGIALQLLFMDAHLKVQDKTEIFSEYLQRRINVLKAFMGQANINWKEAANRLIVEPKITPYIIEDELSKINILQAANGQKQIASRKATIQRLGWAENVDDEEAAIQAEEDREKSYYQGEPTL
ncbi:phage portal protein [Barnesiella sp. An55]|uniref:phage portal protein n=1 Tax=Barnesiella sp. An55 TaxID=1965646 RepID=UPI000B395069|nr:phage portal protein [Barnesiella sp. An55]OUN69487.1 phage portal protein [Barnesiella sp. An55]